MPNLTPEQRKDVDDRIESFRKAHEELKTKYQVEIGYMPQWIPTAQGNFVTVVIADFIDMKYRNPSPIQDVAKT